MSRRWHIKADGVTGSSNKTDLIGCSLAKDSHTHQYLFMGPEANGLPLAAVDDTVEPPFLFPKFTAALNGPDPLDWYIRVDQADDGPNGKAQGIWSNTPLQVGPGGGDPSESGGDTDTWTTQAGVGPDPEDNKKDKKKAAGSASSN